MKWSTGPPFLKMVGNELRKSACLILLLLLFIYTAGWLSECGNLQLPPPQKEMTAVPGVPTEQRVSWNNTPLLL